MIDKENNIIKIDDENGNSKEYTILISFDTDEDKTYYVYTEDELDDDGFIKTYAGIYDDSDGERLLPIQSDEEWELIETLIDGLDKES